MNYAQIDPNLLEEAANAALDHGRYNLDREPLEKAVKRFLALAERDSSKPEDRYRAISKLGEALCFLGERWPESTVFNESTDVLRAGLDKIPRSDMPLEWGQLKSNFGHVLSTLGRRHNNSTHLQEAILVFRDAQQELSRDRRPLDWAKTQNRLGIALWSLGKLENDPTRLREAIAAFRDTLKERTKERVPLEWAATLNNLALVLVQLGEREQAPEYLSQAVDACRDALSTLTSAVADALSIVKTRYTLANALRGLGKLQNNSKYLQEAVAVYGQALSDVTRESMPLIWAQIYGERGIAYTFLAEANQDVALAEKAVSQLEEALASINVKGNAEVRSYLDDHLRVGRNVVADLKSKGAAG